MGNQPPPSAARLKQGNPICRPTQYRTRAAKNDSASAYRFYRNAKKLQARRFAPRNDGFCHFCFAISFAACPNMFLRASSSNGSFANFPIASPACT
jgi:hypothetical protein